MPAARIVAAAAVVAALVYAPIDLLHVWRDVRNAHAEPRAFRARVPAESVGIDEAAAVQRAAGVIPPTATYAVVTGPGARAGSAQSLDHVPFWAAFNLLPRRRVSRVQDAQWVLSYGADPHALGVRVRRVVDLGGGVTAVEVEP